MENKMKSMRNTLIALALLSMLSIAGCSREEIPGRLPQDQESLIGRSISIKATVSDFVQTKVSTTVNHNGQMNLYDEIHIYRQYYSEDQKLFYWPKPLRENAPGALYWLTGIETGRDVINPIWSPKPGASFSFKYKDLDDIDQTYINSPQSAGDSLTWENSETVRFRAWAKSHFDGYDDYMVANWVTASGPTNEIHLDFRHPGCRIGFVPYSGNTFSKIEISRDLEDYTEKYGEDGQTNLELVSAAYNKMRKPSFRAEYDDFSYEPALDDDGNTIRPVFCALAGNMYLISMPYDEDGMPIHLPECTLFKVFLYDINDGDKAQTANQESACHVVRLGDICKLDAGGHITDELAFPDGLDMIAGYSYLFTVGYRYDQLTVTAADNFSWVQQDLEAASGTDERKDLEEYDATNHYTWFKTALKEAADEAEQTAVFNPKFHIKTQQDLRELISIVNGIKLYNTDFKTDQLVFTQYHPLEGTNPAHTSKDTLVKPFSFYSYSALKRFSIFLDNDIDMQDWKLDGIGNTEATPFEGIFDGQGHTLSNLNITGESLFGIVKDGSIKNLKVESTHPLRLAGSCQDEQIIGCSILAPSSQNSLAVSAKGDCAFVGCIHCGESSGPLVGSAESIIMMGCLQASDGLGSGAAFYGTGATADGGFIANYYDISLSPASTPTGSTTLGSYETLDYIRGYKSYILKAVEDNLLSPEMIKQLPADQQKNYYGAAPWKAMNYAIAIFNENLAQPNNLCEMHYEVDETGYSNRYPSLEQGVPSEAQYIDLTNVQN
jgi:hypothetical protein